MVRCVFRINDGKIFETEVEANQHERYVEGLNKLKTILFESPVTKIAMIEQKLVNEEFIGKLVAWLLSHPARTPAGGVLRMVDFDVTQFDRRSGGNANRSDQHVSGAALGATPTRMPGIAAKNLQATKK